MLLDLRRLRDAVEFLGLSRIAGETATVHVEPTVGEQIPAMLRMRKHVQYIAACAPQGQDVRMECHPDDVIEHSVLL